MTHPAELGTVKIRAEKLDELRRISRQADKLTSEVERLRSISTAAFVVLLRLDEGSSRLPEAVEALRRAILEASR